MTSGYYGTSLASHPHGGTPDKLIQELENEFGSLYDPCPNDFYECGLSVSWLEKLVSEDKQTVFVNPPYSRGQLKKWVEKAYKEWRENNIRIVMLIPSYTDTKYFHDYIYNNAELRFLKGRLKFKGYDSKASFPSMLVIFRGAYY